MLKKITAILALASLLAYSAVNYPYPQRKLYGSGIINVKNSSADADLKNKFKQYLENFYVAQGDQARIKFFDPDKPSDANYTVSEGIGYAMLMAVYFSDATENYQSQFDKLWAYYKAHTNGNGFMHWKINGFGSADQQNGATDGDLDVALALLMAFYQFGDTKYETDAKNLAAKIRTHEVSSDGLLKPGDAWDSDRNPSYVSPAVFELFKSYDNTWDAVLTKNYSFLKTNQNGTTGLPSDWADNSGNPKKCSACGYDGINYGQDAVRAPWRWATANAWFGHSDANTLITRLGNWVKNQTPAAVKGPISLTGTMGSNANSSYIGSLMCGLTNNSAYQSNLNSFFSTMMGQTGTADASYYNQSMLILTGLLVSGNMPNLKACKAGNCGTNMPPAGGGDGSSTVLDRLAVAGQDIEDNRSLSALWEAWYAYTDKDADDSKGGKAQSSITNVKFKAKDEYDNCKEIDSYRVVLQEGSDWAVKIPSYTLSRGTYEYEPFVGLGLDSRKNGSGYDLSKCTGGFSYQYKGSAHKFKVLSTTIKEGSGEDHYKNITTASTSAWTTVAIPPDELSQPTWVEKDKLTPFQLSKVRAWAWELVGVSKKDAEAGNTTGLSANTGSLAIKDFKCLGTMTLPTYKTPTCGAPAEPPVGSGDNPGGGNSSSSKASSSSNNSNAGSSSSSSSNVSNVSSSSGGGGSGSSSSSGGGNNNNSSSSRGNSSSSFSSSSSGSSTPIIYLSQHVASNGVFAIKNGVNLQVSKTANMEVFGLNGKSLRNHEFSNGNYSITLGDLPKGLYIVKIQFGEQKEILRVPVR
jgi:endoglucanase